jgi:hypothetical protein
MPNCTARNLARISFCRTFASQFKRVNCPNCQRGKEADLNYENLFFMENQMMYPYYPYYDGRHQGRGMAATGIGLAAGLGGGALLFGIAGWLGLNAASRARARAAEQLALANQNAINNVSALLLQERNSRESWQNLHAPTIAQYIDVRAGAGAGAGANALSVAEALALQNNGINSAIGRDCYLRVQRYSAPQPCGCDSCNG